MSLMRWDKPHFKHEEPSRLDERIEADAIEDANLRRWNAEIDKRDGKRCRACGKASELDVSLLKRGHRAHIKYASAGGTNAPDNRVTLCYRCHNDEHKNRLRFTADGSILGVDANKPMEFWRKDKDGQFYLSKRETTIGRIEKD